jgi:periplasmic protein CpxP/Spy
MKSIRNLLAGTLLAAGALAAAATSISTATAADDATTTPTPPSGPQGWHHHHHGPWHLLSQLGLSAAQQASIKLIMTNARPQLQSIREQIHANSLKLRQTQPNNPNYTSIVAQVSQTHGSLSAQMMSEMATVRSAVFNVLTQPQQAQLATLEAQMQAHKHGTGAGAPPAPAGE